MAFKYSTGFKKAICDTGSVKATFDGGFIKVYSAPTAPPVDADAALPADSVLLVTYSVDGVGTGLTLAAAAVGGTIEKNASETWKGTGAAATPSTPAFFRYMQTGDTGALSTTAKRIQGLIGTSGADMNLSSMTITSGSEYTLDYFSLTFLGG
jgi:hypothetical protein